jgi:hypothetical protein
MKRMLALMLLVGAIFGLLGQQTAAAAASMPAIRLSSVNMSADCMEMMGAHKPDPAKKPCNGMTLDCILAMGCAVPLMRETLAPIPRVQVPARQYFWGTTAKLVGSDRPPEIHPPTILD